MVIQHVQSLSKTALAVPTLSLQVFVSPLENAIQALENKAQELRSLVSQYQIQEREQGGQPGTLTSIQPLSMSLNGVIDAAVNGGISRYQEVRITL